MRYMMLIYIDEKALTEDERAKCYAASAAYARELDEKGQFVATSPLYPTATATSVKAGDGGKRIVMDGPFAETREQLGGFFIVDVKNKDEAIEIAKKIPAGRFGTVEVRPIIPVEGLPS